MAENTQDTVDTRLSICESCEFNTYKVEPNFNVCVKGEDVAINIIVKTDSCPIGKW